MDYARILDIPCVFSSNDDGFLFHDRTAIDSSIETELPLEHFPSTDALWSRFKIFKGIISEEKERIVAQEFYSGCDVNLWY